MDGELTGRQKKLTMDRIYNNEALLAVVILKILESGAMDLARLLLMTTILLDDLSRGRLEKSVNAEDFRLKMSRTSKSFNRKYREMTIIFMNAIQMLRQAGRLRYVETTSVELVSSVSDKNFSEIQSDRMKRILSSVDIILDKFHEVPTATIYNQLRIQL